MLKWNTVEGKRPPKRKRLFLIASPQNHASDVRMSANMSEVILGYWTGSEFVPLQRDILLGAQVKVSHWAEVRANLPNNLKLPPRVPLEEDA
jgi:hypothetical protein